MKWQDRYDISKALSEIYERTGDERSLQIIPTRDGVGRSEANLLLGIAIPRTVSDPLATTATVGWSSTYALYAALTGPGSSITVHASNMSLIANYSLSAAQQARINSVGVPFFPIYIDGDMASTVTETINMYIQTLSGLVVGGTTYPSQLFSVYIGS